jgi:arabinogalactan oligomer/maltooligosaccharide transport system permease protein
MASDSAVPKPSALARAIGFFSGTVGLVIKLGLLGVLNALALWAIGILLADGKWVAAIVLAAATLAIDAVYLIPDRRLVPLKYLVPGTVFPVAFVAIPIVSNVNIAFTNWSTLHNLTKDEAIVAIEERSLVAPTDGAT